MTKRTESPGRAKHTRRPPRTAVAAAIPEGDPAEPGRIVERPDGFHWVALDGRQEFGPFETVEEARADMLDAVDQAMPQPGEELLEAESEIGIADWLDPETGEPAEGGCPPHLEPE